MITKPTQPVRSGKTSYSSNSLKPAERMAVLLNGTLRRQLRAPLLPSEKLAASFNVVRIFRAIGNGFPLEVPCNQLSFSTSDAVVMYEFLRLAS